MQLLRNDVFRVLALKREETIDINPHDFEIKVFFRVRSF